MQSKLGRIVTTAAMMALVVAVSLSGVSVAQDMMHTSSKFEGPKANKGTVTHSTENGKSVLTLSADFVVPDTPDPHWQLVDSKGNTYLLDKLTLKGDKQVRKITVPAFVKDVKKVIIWCAWAEANLGEASFAKPVM